MFRAYAALLTLGLIWGSNFIYMKWATALISPAQTVFLRVLFGFLPLLFIAWRSKVLTRKQWAHIPHFAVMSVLAASFYYYGFVAGTALLSSSVAGLLSGAIPIFTCLCAALLLPDERPTKQMTIGVALGFVGIVLSAQPWEGDSGISLLGVAWMLLGSLSLGGSYVYTRRYLSPLKLPPLALATWQTGFALLTLLVLTDFTDIGQLATSSQALWGTIIGLGVLGTGAAFLLYYFLIEHLGPVRAVGATYIALIVAVIIGAAIGDHITFLQIIALVLILGGVLLIQTAKRSLVPTASKLATDLATKNIEKVLPH